MENEPREQAHEQNVTPQESYRAEETSGQPVERSSFDSPPVSESRDPSAPSDPGKPPEDSGAPMPNRGRGRGRRPPPRDRRGRRGGRRDSRGHFHGPQERHVPHNVHPQRSHYEDRDRDRGTAGPESPDRRDEGYDSPRRSLIEELRAEVDQIRDTLEGVLKDLDEVSENLTRAEHEKDIAEAEIEQLREQIRRLHR